MPRPKKDPAFLFNPKDWLSGTRSLGPLGRGVYIDMLCLQFETGPLDDDPDAIANAVGADRNQVREVWPRLRQKFTSEGCQPGKIVNARLQEVQREQQERRQRQSSAGKASAAARAMAARSTGQATLPLIWEPNSQAVILNEVSTETSTERQRNVNQNPTEIPSEPAATAIAHKDPKRPDQDQIQDQDQKRVSPAGAGARMGDSDSAPNTCTVEVGPPIPLDRARFGAAWERATRKPLGLFIERYVDQAVALLAAGARIQGEDQWQFTDRVLAAYVECLDDAARRGKHNGAASVIELVTPSRGGTTGFDRAIAWLDGKRPSRDATRGGVVGIAPVPKQVVVGRQT